ncbi:MAG: class I SAM-dependent RNA methyltransferase [Pseudomonadota bacterium]
MEEMTIERLGLGGDGVAEGPIYAPRTLPGERVRGTLDGQRLSNIKIVEASPDRVSAPCRHFRSCGGCQLQHASDDFVAHWKVELVRRALAAQNLETVFRPIATSPSRTRRRAGFAARRTKKGATVGFFARGSDVNVEIPDCQLVTPALAGGVEVARALAAVGASRKSVLSVMVTDSPAGLDISVTDGKPLDAPMRADLAQISETHRFSRLAWNGETVALRAPPEQHFEGIAVVPPAGAFLQATQHGTETLTHAVQEIVGDARHVTDLFAGCGTFALPLARGAEVHAVEGDAAMLATLDHGWRHAAGLKKVTTEVRDLFRRPLMPDELARSEAVVLDPPRAGAGAQVAELARAPVQRSVAYISCNPVTFARDARVLVNADFTLEWIQVVDQFRWSAHVELVARFTASHMRKA